jgi:predicted Zn-dependent protease
MANAFSLPGGHIYVFRGLLDEFISNEAQLAFVLAHEIAHVDGRHSIAFDLALRRLPEEIRDSAGGLIHYFVNQPFSMNREEEADLEGLKLLLAAGYSPYQSVAFLDKMAARRQMQGPQNLLDVLSRELNDLFDSHPNLDRRACQMKNLVLEQLKLKSADSYYLGEANYQKKIPKSEQMF